MNADYYKKVQRLDKFCSKDNMGPGWTRDVWQDGNWLMASEGHMLRALPVMDVLAATRNASLSLESDQATGPLNRVLDNARSASRVHVSLDRQDMLAYCKTLLDIEKRFLKRPEVSKDAKKRGPVLTLSWVEDTPHAVRLSSSRERNLKIGVLLWAEFEDEFSKFSFNPKFMIEILQSFEADEVTFGLHDSTSAVWISSNKTEDGFALLMPVNLREDGQ